MLQFSHQMFNLFALLGHDVLKPATPLTNGAIDETLQWFVPVSDDCLLQLVDSCESSTLINHLLKGNPNSAIVWIQVMAVWVPHVRTLRFLSPPCLGGLGTTYELQLELIRKRVMD